MIPTMHLRNLCRGWQEMEGSDGVIRVPAFFTLQQWWYDPSVSRCIATSEIFSPSEPRNPNCVGEWRDVEIVK